jgi:hypothetical protein
MATLQSLTTNVGIALPSITGNIDILGLPGGNIVTTAPIANTVYIGLDTNISVTSLTLNGFADGVLKTTGGVVSSFAGTDGQILIGATGANPVWASITAGAGINITNAANSIIISDSSAILTINNQAGATYTLALADQGAMVILSHGTAAGITVPTNAAVPFPIGTQILLSQGGVGATGIFAAGGVTINCADTTLVFYAQYSVACLVKTGADSWHLSGDFV